MRYYRNDRTRYQSPEAGKVAMVLVVFFNVLAGIVLSVIFLS